MSNNNDVKWVNTSCNGCFSACAIQVKARDGKIIDLRGNPGVPSSRGKLCGKSLARIADLYNPDRVTRPLMRTNPEKGLGIDPKWKEIGWEKALEIITKRLEDVRQGDPRELAIAVFEAPNSFVTQAFGQAFGTTNYDFNNGGYCGSGLHTVFSHTFGTANSEIDVDHCERLVLWGAQLGHGANNNPTKAARSMAEAKHRDTRLIVIDPLLGNAAAKADQWIPIRPGSDGAMALAIVNLLLNEFRIFDEDFLKRRTNGTYLIGKDGHYLRDEKTAKPMVWDIDNKAAVPFDSTDPGRTELEGSFKINEAQYQTAFELLKKGVAEWTAERASSIAGVPTEIIRNFAREHGEAAKIGATIEIQGKTLPWRPAAIDFKRGVNAHKNSYFSCFSIQLINIILGAMDVPGGLLGVNAFGPYGAWAAKTGEDGLLESDMLTDHARSNGFRKCYPPNPVHVPESFDMEGLFPMSGFLANLFHYSMSEPEKVGLDYHPSALIVCRTNFLKSYYDPKSIAAYLQKLDFILGFAIQIDETCEFADILLPEAHDFERYFLYPVNAPPAFIPPGLGDWYLQWIRPVVDPPEGIKNWMDILFEIADRLGTRDAMNAHLSNGIGLMDDFSLSAGEKYSLEDVCRRQVRMFGAMAGIEDPEKSLEETGMLPLYQRTLEESFPGTVLEARIPIYLEHFIDVGKAVEAIVKEQQINWLDTDFYKPLPTWHPCPSQVRVDDGFDLFLANGKAALLTHSINSENPWVDEISDLNPYCRYILLHTKAAKSRGIKDEDEVFVESSTGRVKGRVRVTECVHQDVVGTFGNGGGWARGRPISAGKGVHSNALVPFDWSMIDPISGQIDTCARVKIYRVAE